MGTKLKKTNPTLLMLPFTVVLFAGALGAEESSKLSLVKCLDIARSRSIQNIQASLARQQANFALDEAHGNKLPQLSLLGALSKSDDDANQLPDANKGTVRLEQALSPFTPKWIEASQRRAEVEVATTNQLSSQADVNLVIKQLYFSVLNGQDSIKYLADVEVQIKKLQDRVLPKYNVGRAAPFDVVKVKTSLSDLMRKRELLEAQYASNVAQLALALYNDADTPLLLEPITHLPVFPAGGRQGRIADLVAQNPSLTALDRQIEVSKWNVKSTQYQRYPEIVAAAEYGYAGKTANEMSLGWDLSAGIKLPLYDGGIINSQIAKQRIAVSSAEAELTQEKQKATAEAVQTKALAVAHLSDRSRLNLLLPELREAADVAISRYSQGATSIIEVTDAIALWSDNLINERDAFYSYLADLAKWERVVGKEDVQYE